MCACIFHSIAGESRRKGIFTGEGTKAKFFMSFKKIIPPKFPVGSVGW